MRSGRYRFPSVARGRVSWAVFARRVVGRFFVALNDVQVLEPAPEPEALESDFRPVPDAGWLPHGDQRCGFGEKVSGNVGSAVAAGLQEAGALAAVGPDRLPLVDLRGDVARDDLCLAVGEDAGLRQGEAVAERDRRAVANGVDVLEVGG